MRTFYMLIFYLLILGPIIIGFTGARASAEEVEEKAHTPIDYEEYTIGLGDVLEINVWDEPKVSREQKVRLDGRITLPLIGDVEAAGITPMQLSDVITDELSQFITAPEVTVTVLSQTHHKYYVIGEVQNTGEYQLEKDLTLLQVLAKVKGFTEWADKDSIILLRRDKDEEKIIHFNYEEVIEAKNQEQNIFIQANDTIIVP